MVHGTSRYSEDARGRALHVRRGRALPRMARLRSHHEARSLQIIGHFIVYSDKAFELQARGKTP